MAEVRTRCFFTKRVLPYGKHLAFKVSLPLDYGRSAYPLLSYQKGRTKHTKSQLLVAVFACPMNTMDLREAQLFRMLTDLFGKDQVIFGMSAMAVSGGSLQVDPSDYSIDIEKWARANKCLFTVVDQKDLPKLVVEFFAGYSKSVDVREVEHEQYLRPILEAAEIRYVTITNEEFIEVLDPQGALDLCQLISFHVKDPAGFQKPRLMTDEPRYFPSIGLPIFRVIE